MNLLSDIWKLFAMSATSVSFPMIGMLLYISPSIFQAVTRKKPLREVYNGDFAEGVIKIILLSLTILFGAVVGIVLNQDQVSEECLTFCVRSLGMLIYLMLFGTVAVYKSVRGIIYISKLSKEIDNALDDSRGDKDADK